MYYRRFYCLASLSTSSIQCHLKTRAFVYTITSGKLSLFSPGVSVFVFDKLVCSLTVFDLQFMFEPRASRPMTQTSCEIAVSCLFKCTILSFFLFSDLHFFARYILLNVCVCVIFFVW